MKKILTLCLAFCSLIAVAQTTVVLNNQNGSIPLKHVENLKIASVNLGDSQGPLFDSIARRYWKIKSFRADTIQDDRGFNFLQDRLRLYNFIILQLSGDSPVSQPVQSFIKDIQSQNQSVTIVSGKITALSKFKNMTSPLILNSSGDGSVAAQVLFGGMASEGKLESDQGGAFKKGSGYITQKTRLGYNVNNDVLTRGIDAIAKEGIAAHSAPAAVILVAKGGKVIFNKAYGNHKYENGQPTRYDDIFDMASVTKVTATTPSVMRLYEQKKIGLDSMVSKYVASTRGYPDKQDIRIREALLHEAGYYPYIKFFELLKPGEMSKDSSAAYPVKVADNYFLRANYFQDVMWPVTLKTKGNTRGQFVYSDVSMYMLKEVVEQASHRSLNEYVLNEFYLPLGMQATGFLPRNRFDRSRIVPTTENDNWFRNMLVQGYVNDPGAAMAGGVEGHAGLFSTANDLAIYYQMLLNKGTYGGQKFFEPSTVDLFTSKQSSVSTRGLGFARLTEAEQKSGKSYPSQQAYGHSGYTGTYVWVDPQYDLVYVCLTNRVYPDDNKTYGVSKVNLRARVLEFIYEEILKGSVK